MEKEQYKERIHLLVERLKTNPDKEYWEYLLLLTQSSFNVKIDDIYELCIEKVIRKQAEGFYAEFPISEIKQSLINDFIRMESFRRKDNFEDFCLALYQQIECMTNKLCTNNVLDEIVCKMWSCSAYIENTKDIEPDISKRAKGNDYNIAKLVLISTSRETYIDKYMRSIQNQYALDKIRIVVYFVGYHAMMRYYDYENYVEITNSLNDIYQCRNLNHRGTKNTEWEQKILDRILPQKSYYYFKFLGTLAQYVNYIIDGVKELPKMLDYAKTINPKPIVAGPKVIRQIDPSLLNDGKKRIK